MKTIGKLVDMKSSEIPFRELNLRLRDIYTLATWFPVLLFTNVELWCHGFDFLKRIKWPKVRLKKTENTKDYCKNICRGANLSGGLLISL